ncbi:hypothetical protein GOODEAATRI_015440 [Goodea atripinnis]|uniref:Translation initiation factor eIF2 assembly protein n=1 Tax=Goodea atripinnis TaxID=208336 RepID=A0ABV0MU80_9TELE
MSWVRTDHCSIWFHSYLTILNLLSFSFLPSDHNSQPIQTSDAEEDIQWSDDETTATATAPEFPEFTSAVLEAINALGGRVFPKLNWSAPRVKAQRSAAQCSHGEDLVQFSFRSSITAGIIKRFLQCSDQDSPDPVISYELVLRKWSELIPGGEFRCFVKENKLIAISQRDYTQYYQHILKQEEQISQAIQEFFSQHVQYNFLDEDCELQLFLSGKVWLIDLNPFGEVTDSLLFSWDELMSGGETAYQQQEGPAFRYTTSEVTVQPSPCLSYRIPRDFVDLSTGEDAFKLVDFLKLVSTDVCKEQFSVPSL